METFSVSQLGEFPDLTQTAIIISLAFQSSESFYFQNLFSNEDYF